MQAPPLPTLQKKKKKKKPEVNFTICLGGVFSKKAARNANSYISEEQEQTKQWKDVRQIT